MVCLINRTDTLSVKPSRDYISNVERSGHDQTWGSDTLERANIVGKPMELLQKREYPRLIQHSSSRICQSPSQALKRVNYH